MRLVTAEKCVIGFLVMKLEENLVGAWIFKKCLRGWGRLDSCLTDCDTGTAWSLNVTPNAPRFLYCFRPFNILLSQLIHSGCTPVKVISTVVCNQYNTHS